MGTILAIVVPLIIKLLDIFITQRDASNEAKKKFLEFIESMDKHRIQSAALKKSYEEQLKKLQEQIGQGKA